MYELSDAACDILVHPAERAAAVQLRERGQGTERSQLRRFQRGILCRRRRAKHDPEKS